MYDLPDERGHFGPYGGVFVAETLIEALDQLEGRIRALPAGPAIPRRVRIRTQTLRRTSQPGLPCATLVGAFRRRAGLSQARGPQSHRRAQDQQHRRPGAACQAHGQTARDRRDRRRPARRGGRDGRRALRHGMRGLHGLGGHQAPGAERLSHEIARRERGAGRIGLEDAQGRAQRGDARLGDQRQ